MTTVEEVGLRTIAKEWLRIGVTGFGGPPAHIALLRRLCVDRQEWISSREFEDAIAAASLLPGPASTQLAIFCAWRLRRTAGALVGGLAFIVPGLIAIIALSVLFLEHRPPAFVEGMAAGAGAAVPAVALGAALALVPGIWKQIRHNRAVQLRCGSYFCLGAVASAAFGELVVVALAACGLAELAINEWPRRHERAAQLVGFTPLLAALRDPAGLAALAWTSIKVGALSWGGGFVIIPLMQHDAVSSYHWMTKAQFLSAVALGQVTPGPVVQTVSVVGYAAGGVGGALLAALIAFAPSFAFVLAGGSHFGRLRTSTAAKSFLTGAGPAAVGAIAGAALPLGLALGHLWQVGLLCGALLFVVVLRRSVVLALLSAALIGGLAVLAGAAVG